MLSETFTAPENKKPEGQKKKKGENGERVSLSPERAVNAATTCLVRFLQPSTAKRGASTSVSLSFFFLLKRKKKAL